MILRLALVFAVALALCGCHRKKITTLERDEAANMASEAEFAVTMKDWGRAEGLYAKAVGLCPDDGDAWVKLGIVRMRLGDHAGARTAYKAALSAFGDALDKDSSGSQYVLKRAYVLVILGRADDARSSVEKAYKRLPDDRNLRRFVEDRELDALIADPTLKSLSP